MKPIYKKDSRTDKENLRPAVSCLTSKTWEICGLKELNNRLHCGFRTGYRVVNCFIAYDREMEAVH